MSTNRERPQGQGQSQGQGHEQHGHVAKEYPASKVHHMGPEGEGPTPDEEFAEDTNLAAQERGAHAERPVGGTKADDDKP